MVSMSGKFDGLANAHTLLERGVFDEEELRSRMDALRERANRR